MISYSILAPDLDASQTRLLRAHVTHARLPWTPPVAELAGIRHVLSVGRAALDTWHDFGLIRVNANRGDLFTHVSQTTGRTYHVLVVQHPGTLQQLSFVGHQARDDMAADLRRWRMILSGAPSSGYAPALCGGCLKLKEVRQREATYWVEALDGVGLCEDHYRKRAKYRRRVERIAKKDRGKPAAQIQGQGEMFADGARVMVSKG